MNTVVVTTEISSKPRYEILDGLRGVAALLVLLYHHCELYGGGALTTVINHGYLAGAGSIALAWVALEFYDKPVRRWLVRKRA